MLGAGQADAKMFKGMYLIFELSDLPLAGGITLQVVQHNLCISQKDFGSLQVFPEPLLCLHIPLAHLNDKPLLYSPASLLSSLKTYSNPWDSKAFSFQSKQVADTKLHRLDYTDMFRVMTVPGPEHSAVWIPALVSLATLFACLHTPPPAVPPSVSAVEHSVKMHKCWIHDKVRHYTPSTVLLDTAALKDK